MEIITSFMLTLIASLSSLIGIIFTYIKCKRVEYIIVISLSFSFGVMTLLSTKELIPISLHYLVDKISIIYIILIPLMIYFIVNLLNKNINYTNSLYRVGILSCITLIIHNILEGTLTFMTSYLNTNIGIKIALAIIAHNIPEGILISIPIYYSTKSRGRAFIYTFTAAISEVFGALLIYLLFKQYISVLIINLITYIVGCLMIIISFKEILPEIIKYNNKLLSMIGLLLSLFILLL